MSTNTIIRDAEAYQGGSYVSRNTGRCLEVSKFELEPLVQGKRIQTGHCHVSPFLT